MANLRAVLLITAVSGAANTIRPTPPTNPAAVVTNNTTNGSKFNDEPYATGAKKFCNTLFTNNNTANMINASVNPCAPNAIKHTKIPAMIAPKNGTYAVTNVINAIVPTIGTPNNHAVNATGTALLAAMIVVPRK